MTRRGRQIFAPPVRGVYQYRRRLLQRGVVGIHQPSEQHAACFAAEPRKFGAALMAVVHGPGLDESSRRGLTVAQSDFIEQSRVSDRPSGRLRRNGRGREIPPALS
jgi:hypothetical protein